MVRGATPNSHDDTGLGEITELKLSMLQREKSDQTELLAHLSSTLGSDDTIWLDVWKGCSEETCREVKTAIEAVFAKLQTDGNEDEGENPDPEYSSEESERLLAFRIERAKTPAVKRPQAPRKATHLLQTCTELRGQFRRLKAEYDTINTELRIQMNQFKQVQDEVSRAIVNSVDAAISKDFPQTVLRARYERESAMLGLKVRWLGTPLHASGSWLQHVPGPDICHRCRNRRSEYVFTRCQPDAHQCICAGCYPIIREEARAQGRTTGGRNPMLGVINCPVCGKPHVLSNVIRVAPPSNV